MTSGEFWWAVASGMVTNFLYTLLIALALLLMAGAIVRRDRQRLFTLVGLGSQTSTVRIFTSRVDVLKSGSQGTDGRTAVGFIGPALVHPEYSAGLAVETLIRHSHLDALPGFLRKLLQRQSSYLRDIEVVIDVSPGGDSYRPLLENGSDSVILIGSDVYSHAVRHAYEQSSSFLRFVCEATGEKFNASRTDHGDPTFAVATDGEWQIVPARALGREIGTVQRVTMPSGRRLLMLAGLSSASTRDAVLYFCNHWRQLYRRHGDADFLIVVAFNGQQPDDHFLAHPEELPELARQRPARAAIPAPALR